MFMKAVKKLKTFKAEESQMDNGTTFSLRD